MYNDSDKTTHVEIVENPDVIAFLKQCEYMVEPSGAEAREVASLFSLVNRNEESLPTNIISIDGSCYEASLDDKLPFTRVGYVKIGNILIKKDEFLGLGNERYVDPFKVAEMEKINQSTIFTFPSSNMLYKGKDSVRDSFRAALDHYLYKYRNHPDKPETSLRTTLFKLASYRNGLKSDAEDELLLHVCPNCGAEKITVWDVEEEQCCPHCGKAVYPSDCLRIWEEVDDNGSNQSALTRFTNVIEHVFVVHYVRTIIESSPQSYVDALSDICFFMDGPLAIFGNAAWVHNSIMKYLYQINSVLEEHNKKPILIIGLVKSGSVIDYFRLIQNEVKEDTVLCLSDEVRNKYVNFNRKASNSTFGNETYYGQDFIYKAKSGKLIVFNLPYPFESKGNVEKFIAEKAKMSNYINLNGCISLIDEFECDLYDNTVVPVALARKHTVISLKPGTQVLDLLTKMNM